MKRKMLTLYSDKLGNDLLKGVVSLGFGNEER